MKELKKLEKMIIILFIIIILILILILKLNKNTNDSTIEKDELSNEITEKVVETNENGFKKVDDPNIFFSVIDSLNKYINVLNYEINEDDTLEENTYEIKNEHDKKKILFSMLDSDYKEENNIISEDDIILEKNINRNSFIPIEMKVKYGDRIQVYALHGYLENVVERSLEEKYFIIKMDNTNSTFSVKPLNEKYKQIDEIEENQEFKNIEVNNYNEYYIDNISDEALVKMYMERYRYMSVNYPKVIYDNYFDKEYRDARFGSVENFINYVENVRDEISEIKAIKYSKNIYMDYNEYIIIDQYNNTYIFNENSIMDFTLRLDNYTITTDKFKETYLRTKDENKVQMNIDKFIQMINRHDYRTSYNCISQEFKNNYLKTQKEFEIFIKSAFFDYNEISIKSLEEQNGVYIGDFEINDITGKSSEKRNISMIIKLNDNFDFEMAFGVE